MTDYTKFDKVSYGGRNAVLLDDDICVSDVVNHPTHYTSHPSGVECIQITEHMTFTIGSAFKYLWRYDLKNGVEDLKKARWYIDREIKNLEES